MDFCTFSVYISSVMDRSNFNIAPKHKKFITVR